MSEMEFDALINDLVERTAIGAGEMPVELFLDALLGRIAARMSATR